MQHEQHKLCAACSAHYRGRIGEKILRMRKKRMISAASANSFRVQREAQFDRMGCAGYQPFSLFRRLS
jgi:hypothetical protein